MRRLSLSEIASLVYERFAPSPLLLGEKGLLVCAKDAIRELNKYVWILREVTLVPGRKVSLPNEIASIAQVALGRSGVNSIESYGSKWMYHQHAVADAYAVHDYFIWRLQLQIMRAVSSFSLRFEKHGQYLYLEDVPLGVSQVHIEYFPLFDPDTDSSPEVLVGEAGGEVRELPSKSWMFDEREITFLLGYTEGLAMMREGRLLRKAKNMEVTTDADDLFTQGEKQCDELIKEICDQPALVFAKS